MSSNDPLAAFFTGYPLFHYNPSNAPTSEFGRLCDTYHWGRRNNDRKTAHQAFRAALTQQFNANYGTNVNSLESWQLLAGRIGIEPVPDTLKECRQKVKGSYINLVDLVAAYPQGQQVTRFPSEVALSEYTLETQKFFPRDAIGAGDLLKYLRRQIRHPRENRGRSRRGRGGGRGGGTGRGGG